MLTIIGLIQLWCHRCSIVPSHYGLLIMSVSAVMFLCITAVRRVWGMASLILLAYFMISEHGFTVFDDGILLLDVRQTILNVLVLRIVRNTHSGGYCLIRGNLVLYAIDVGNISRSISANLTTGIWMIVGEYWTIKTVKAFTQRHVVREVFSSLSRFRGKQFNYPILRSSLWSFDGRELWNLRCWAEVWCWSSLTMFCGF